MTLGREESRAAVMDDCRDFCKLHIMLHYVAVLLGTSTDEDDSFQTIPVGKVGNDPVGREMVRLMNETGMDTRYVITTDSAPTLFSVCFLYPDRAGGNITTSRSASSLLRPNEIDAARQLCQEFGSRGMALAAPEVPLESRLELLTMAGQSGLVRFTTLTTAEMADQARRRVYRQHGVSGYQPRRGRGTLRQELRWRGPAAVSGGTGTQGRPAEPGYQAAGHRG